MDQLTRTPSWPAAPRSGIILVQHPAWEAARNAVLDRAAEGPVTVFLTGEPGSGKTWLLRELASCLGEHGFPTMMLLRGDLPVPLGDGVAVLVDEASYMPEPTRASLAVQDRGVVVLADIGPFEIEPVDGGPAPVFIHLRLLDAAEIGPFVADWLQQEKMSSMVLEPDALSRLADHSGGAVRLITQFLTAAIAVSRTSGDLHLTADLIDQVAGFRLGAIVPDLASDIASAAIPPAPAPQAVIPAPQAPLLAPQAPLPPPRFAPAAPEPVVAAIPTLPPPIPARRAKLRYARTATAATAMAASVLAAWMVPGLLHRAPPSNVATPALKLPPIQSAQTAIPDVVPTAPPVVTAARAIQEPSAPTSSTLAARVVPTPARSQAPAVAPDALPPLQAANVPEPIAAAPVTQPPLTAQLVEPPLIAPAAQPSLQATVPNPSVAVALAQIGAPHTVSPSPAASPPIAVASVPKPVAIPVIASGTLAATPVVARPAAAGLVLVARPGDTLERLYADIYHDRRAPPFAAILAANPNKFRPGAIVVFPEPVGGWGHTQR